jgi:hypothetical protein
MKTNRLWLEIVILGTAIACILALLFATLGAAASVAEGEVSMQQPVAPSLQQSYDGMVTCSRCGAKHSAKLDRSASVCTRVCVHDGASFALVDANFTYLLDGDLTALKKFAGQRAHLVGTLHGSRLSVSSVTAAT